MYAESSFSYARSKDDWSEDSTVSALHQQGQFTQNLTTPIDNKLKTTLQHLRVMQDSIGSDPRARVTTSVNALEYVAKTIDTSLDWRGLVRRYLLDQWVVDDIARHIEHAYSSFALGTAIKDRLTENRKFYGDIELVVASAISWQADRAYKMRYERISRSAKSYLEL